MKKIKQFFKAWWESLEMTLDEPENYPYQHKEKDVSAQCPWCGYMGSSDEVRCHCLNYHKR